MALAAAADEITIGTSGVGEDGQALSPRLAARIAADTSPFTLTRQVALQVPAVRRGVNLLAGAIGSLPLVRWRDRMQIPGGQLLEQPEEYRPYCRTIAATVRDLILNQYAWWLVVQRDRTTGFPARIVRLEPEYVSVQHQYGTDQIDSQFATYKGRPVEPGDLICFEGPDEGLLVHGREAIMTALALESAAQRYASPEVPTGVLRQEGQYGLTDPEVDALLDRWESSRRNRATAYLNAGVSYTSVQSSATDLQLVEAREESALQICRHLGIPPRYLAVSSGDSMTYSTIESERRDLVELTLAPLLNSIEQRLSMSDANGSARGQSVRFSLDDFLRGVPLERAQRYSALIPLGVMTADEARTVEDLDGPAPLPPALPENPSPAAPTTPVGTDPERVEQSA
jgi:HK97 family phage portal protein